MTSLTSMATGQVLIGVGASLATMITVSGCVSKEHKEVVAAREAYHPCVDAHSADHPDCKALQATLEGVSRTYEYRAQRAWSCDPAQAECPTPRGR
jgi:hypothetical protein